MLCYQVGYNKGEHYSDLAMFTDETMMTEFVEWLIDTFEVDGIYVHEWFLNDLEDAKLETLEALEKERKN